jgi:hypothetical protein
MALLHGQGWISILIERQLNFHGRLTAGEHRFTPPSLMFAAGTRNDDEVADDPSRCGY